MASASSSSARLLFSESKRTLTERINVNAHNATGVARQVVRGSKSKEMLMSSAKGLAHAENAMDNTLKQLTTIELIIAHIAVQQQSIEVGAQNIDVIGEQVQALGRKCGRPETPTAPDNVAVETVVDASVETVAEDAVETAVVDSAEVSRGAAGEVVDSGA